MNKMEKILALSVGLVVLLILGIFIQLVLSKLMGILIAGAAIATLSFFLLRFLKNFNSADWK